MTADPAVTMIERWQLRPGDRLIVTTDRTPTMAEMDRITAKVRADLHLPATWPVLVHGPEAMVRVAGWEEANHATQAVPAVVEALNAAARRARSHGTGRTGRRASG